MNPPAFRSWERQEKPGALGTQVRLIREDWDWRERTAQEELASPSGWVLRRRPEPQPEPMAQQEPVAR